MGDITALKKQRTTCLKNLNAHATKVEHILKEEIDSEYSHSELLLQDDALFADLVEAHTSLHNSLMELEAKNQAEGKDGAYKQNELVSGKNMIQYLNEASGIHKVTSESLISHIQQENADKKQSAENRAIYRLKRDTTAALVSLKGSESRLGGALLADPNILQNFDDQEILEVKAKLNALYATITRVDLCIEPMVDMDKSQLHEAIDEAENATKAARHHLDNIQSAMFLKEQTSYNKSTAQPTPHTVQPAQPVQPPPIASAHSPGLNPSVPKPKEYKFKPIDIPKFDGSRKKWMRWRSTWKNIVQPQGYSGLYLATQLWESIQKGSARSLVEAVMITDDSSYDDMMKRLEEFYDDQGAILQSLLNDLDTIKPCRNGRNDDVIQFINQVEIIHESLKSLSEDHPKKINVNQVDKLANCLPDEVRNLWNRHYHLLSKVVKESPFSEFIIFCSNERGTRLRFMDIRNPVKPKDAGSYGGQSRSEENKKTQKKTAHCWLDEAHEGHYSSQCSVWKGLTPAERRQVCFEKRKCIKCLDAFGKKHECRNIPSYVLQKFHCNSKDCKIRHRKDIACPSKKDGGSSVESGCISSGAAYIARYEVKVKNVSEKVAIFCDNGSDISFIYDKTAKERGYKLIGTKNLNVTTINGMQKVRSKIYNVPIVTIDGTVENVKCHSINHPVTSRSTGVNLQEIGRLFPKYKSIKRLDRNGKPCEVLLGLDYFHLHPNKTVFQNKDLSIKRGLLGDTLIGMIEGNNDNSSECHTYYISRHQDLTWNKFINGEDLGLSVNPQCGACKCNGCPMPGHTYSFKDEQELELIRSGLIFRNGQWICRCPWIKSPATLPNNRYIAEATLKSTLKTLKKDPSWYDAYNMQIEELLSKGFARELTSKEEEDWKKPVYYICHLAVWAPKSSSTPIRIVFNSSQTCKGVSLNSIQAKGPKIMNSLMEILIRWREYPGVLLGDISKMFYAIKLGKEDQQLHRFLWQGPHDTEPKIYIMLALSMGDVCSPCVAIQALFETGNRVEISHPEASYVLKKSSYVDDLVHSTLAMPIEVAREVEEVLGGHGFKVKEWLFKNEATPRKTLLEDTPTKEDTPKKLLKGDNELTAVLGVNWNSLEDKIQYKTEINFSKKVKGFRSEQDMKEDTFNDDFPQHLTKRMILEQVGRIYDPLGLIGPHALCAKILLRETWELTKTWDEELHNSLYSKWKTWFVSSFQLNDVSFKRCTRPDNPKDEDPELIIFSDGSKEASGACAYVRWKIQESQYESHLIMAKNRIGPKEMISIPLMELNGAVIGTRVRQALLKACRYKFSNIIHLVDSETVLKQVNSLSSKFKAYEGNRVGEIQRLCEGDMSSWYWIPGTSNIADWNTRGKNPSELGSGSEWQKGPCFLAEPMERWPIKSIEEMRKQPEDSLSLHVSLDKAEASIQKRSWMKFHRTKWDIMVRGLALAIKCIRGKKIKKFDLSASSLKEAELIIIKQVQLDLQPDLDTTKPGDTYKSKYRKLGPVLTIEGIWGVGGRCRGAKSYPILIPTGHPCALMLMEKAHKEARHTGIDSTLTKFREKYYVPYGNRLAKRVRQRCTLCRLIDKQTLSQKMGSIPLHLLEEAPAFNFIQLDIFGPWKARGEVQKRTTGKIWGVVFVCLNSKAIHIEMIPGYSTDDFLMGLARFGSLRGWPSKIYSDPGSQLTAADAELKTVWKGIDQEKINSKTVSHGTEWIFSPADSPHRQGVVESLIKSVKRCIKVLHGHQHRLSWQEYLTVAYESADLLNSRPIGTKLVSEELIEVLTPNSLILGRNNSCNPGCFPETNRTPRLSLVNHIISQFWEKWIQVCRPAIIAQQKWYKESRNLKRGDVVLVLENNPLDKQYQLALVTRADPDEDGRVRSAEVCYKKHTSTQKGTHLYTGGTRITVKRSIQRLVLLVPIDEAVTHQNDYSILKGTAEEQKM